MGEYETDYVEFAFKDCVNNHVGSNVWISTSLDVPYAHRLVHYDPDHDDYLDVYDWVVNLPMQQDELIKMRDELDTQPIDLFHDMFETT
jgi:hypothetical protein